MNTSLSANYFFTRVLFWHWNEKCGLCTELNPRLHSAPLTMCVSQHLSPPVDRSACDWSGFLLNRSVKSSIPKSQWPGNHSARLACTCGTLHPTRAPLIGPGLAGVINGDGAVGGGEQELEVEAVFVYKTRRFVKMKVKLFHLLCLREMCEWLHFTFLRSDPPREQVLLSVGFYTP